MLALVWQDSTEKLSTHTLVKIVIYILKSLFDGYGFVIVCCFVLLCVVKMLVPTAEVEVILTCQYLTGVTHSPELMAMCPENGPETCCMQLLD